MVDPKRTDPIAPYWDDYMHEIGPDPRAASRVRGRLDDALRRRGTVASNDAPPQPVQRAAAVIFMIKSSAISVGIAMAGLGGLHLGARAITPAELPPVAHVVEPAADVAPEAPRAPEAVTQPVPQPSTTAGEPVDPPLVVVTPTRAPRSPVAATAPAPVPPPTSAVDTLRAEIELMDRAKSALAAGDDGRVLVLLAEHGERFAKGSMIEERRGWTAIARCRRHAADARALADAFTRDYPRSALLDDLEHACSQHSSTDSKAAAE